MALLISFHASILLSWPPPLIAHFVFSIYVCSLFCLVGYDIASGIRSRFSANKPRVMSTAAVQFVVPRSDCGH